MPGYAGLMTYSLAEAMWLFAEGTSDDLLVGYPTTDRATLQKLAVDEAARARSRSWSTRSTTSTWWTTRSARATRRSGSAWSWTRPGDRCTDRAGCTSARCARRCTPRPRPAELTRRIVDRPGFKLVGIMAYEGPDRRHRRRRRPATRCAAWRCAGCRGSRRPSWPSGERPWSRRCGRWRRWSSSNGGGTGSLEATSAEQAVTEVAAGSGLVGPTLFDGYRSFQPRPAALFALPVVRRPGPNVATLFTGGYPRPDRSARTGCPRPTCRPGLKLTEAGGGGRGADAGHRQGGRPAAGR